jgi:uncharacterized protein (TIGR00369 family)
VPQPAHAARFAPLPPSRVETWSNFLAWPDRTYFPTLVGLTLQEMRTDYARILLPFRPELEQPAGVIHGGVVATLIDSVAVPAIGGGYDERRAMATISMNVEYRSAAAGTDLVVEGWVEQRGRSIVFCRAEVRDDGGSVVAVGSTVYKVSSRTLPGGV